MAGDSIMRVRGEAETISRTFGELILERDLHMLSQIHASIYQELAYIKSFNETSCSRVAWLHQIEMGLIVLR